MAARQMNMFEKLANIGGVIFRYQKAQFPRRLAILRAVWKHELAPPKQADWPAIKKDFAAVIKTIETKGYNQYTVREGVVYAAVFIEVLCWFFIGEMIGRRYIVGYLCPSDYVSKSTRTKAKQIEKENSDI